MRSERGRIHRGEKQVSKFIANGRTEKEFFEGSPTKKKRHRKLRGDTVQRTAGRKGRD